MEQQVEIVNTSTGERKAASPDREAGPPAFEFWVNIYADHDGLIYEGGRTKADADFNHAEVFAAVGDPAPWHRIDCRRLRYVPGQGIFDVTDGPPKWARALTPEERERRQARQQEQKRAYMRDYQRRRREAAAGVEAS